MRTFLIAITATALLAPFAAFAAPNTIAKILEIMTQVVLLAVPTAAVLLLFFWNLSQLLFSVNDAEKKKQAKMRIIWSVIAMFILFSLGGIIAIFKNTFFEAHNGGMIHVAAALVIRN